MSKPSKGVKGSGSKARIIVVAGESTNDREALTHLVRAHLRAFTGKVASINDPVALKDATGTNLSSRVTKIVQKAKALAAKEKADLHGLAMHLDLDDVSRRSYDAVRAKLRAEFADRCPAPLALALATWETEGWLLLFPDAFPEVHAGWTVPQQLRNRDTAQIRNPKEELQRRLGKPPYRESDSQTVVQAAVRLGHAPAKPTGSNHSYRDFLDDLTAW
ncbi:hypothetical protein ACFVFS_00085 [Kitasatospora sp. NPDC057692]|uniref:hypothetical protein n=1 Tax=Kitasatospora sp. NPDC057692 TaxID=3346215 RepID=UPI0036948CA0